MALPYGRSCTTEASLQRAADSQQLEKDALTGSGEQMCAEVLDGLWNFSLSLQARTGYLLPLGENRETMLCKRRF